MFFLIFLLLANLTAAVLHYRYRVVKFVRNRGEKRLLLFTPVITTILGGALLFFHRQTLAPQLFVAVGFMAAMFWFFQTVLNIECNNIIQPDAYGRKWHFYQACQWAVFHCTVTGVSCWQFSLALLGWGVFLFDGLQNRNWKPTPRPWFYVGLHSGAIDTWFTAHPDVSKRKAYISGLVLFQIPFLIYLI